MGNCPTWSLGRSMIGNVEYNAPFGAYHDMLPTNHSRVGPSILTTRNPSAL